ncbi:MAG: hypothetical protein FWD04_10395 [Conexibacteraceae bacterium]|nr:hypothetical protein [Conexibacteraceae bacterium]
MRVREQALKQIERKRQFQTRAFRAAVASLVLVIGWAISEYNNAHGLPTNGFSQSSGIHHVWNYWIIYPLILIAVWIVVDAWNTAWRGPISESEIRREMARISGAD